MSENATLTTILLIASAYPWAELPKETINLYRAMLADIDPELLKAATLQAISKSDRPPSISVIRETAANIAIGPQISGVEAWGEVCKRWTHGRREFTPQIEAAVNAIGGWHMLGMSHQSQMAANRARFIEAYNQLQSRKKNDVIMLPDVKNYQITNGIRQLTDGFKK